jgi:hypothetical protein
MKNLERKAQGALMCKCAEMCRNVPSMPRYAAAPRICVHNAVNADTIS